MSIERDYLVLTGFTFGGRDFRVVVKHDGLSYWTDRSAVGSILDSDFHRMAGEHTVQAPVPDGDLREIREQLSPLFWLEDHEIDEADAKRVDQRLDEILEPIFWEHAATYFSISR